MIETPSVKHYQVHSLDDFLQNHGGGGVGKKQVSSLLFLGFAHQLLCFETDIPTSNRLCYFLEKANNAKLVDGHYLEMKLDFQ